MKCFCRETKDGFCYVVEDAPSYSYSLIEKAYFKKDGTTFVKWYPLDMPDKEIVVPNYERLAPTIFLRKAANWENALNSFCEVAKRNSIEFIIRGSVVACINGANISPTDIDILLDVSDFKKMKTIFKENIIEPLVFNDSLMLVKYFGRLCFDNVWIDVSAFPQKGYEVNKIDTICWKGHIVKIESLESCLDTYRKIERYEYISEIEKILV